MASAISGMGSSPMSSIYGNRPILSGLASGLDTESMIENAVAGHKLKITGLQQKQTRVLWEQDSLRNIINHTVNFSRKFTDYDSDSNLYSASFFNSAVKVASQGTNASKVAATGKSASDIQVLGVKQLASKASYATGLGGPNSAASVPTIAGGELKLGDTLQVSSLSGSIDLTQGEGTAAKTVHLTFSEDKIYKNTDDFVKDINDKLSGSKLSHLEAKWEGDNLVFKEKGTAKNGKIHITASEGNIATTLKLGEADKVHAEDGKLTITAGTPAMKQNHPQNKTVAESLVGKEISVTLDGMTKKITLFDGEDGGSNQAPASMEALQQELTRKLNSDSAFGADKITVSQTGGSGNTGTLTFQTVSHYSSLEIQGAQDMGLVHDRETSYVDMSLSLKDMLTKVGASDQDIKSLYLRPVGSFVEFTADADGNYTDKAGNMLKLKEGANTGSHDVNDYYRVDKDGKALLSFEINGKQVGAFTEDTAMESVLLGINSNENSDVKVSYSKTTNEFLFTSKQSGEGQKIEFGGAAEKLFGSPNPAGDENYKKGQNAIFTMMVNNRVMDNVERSTNNFDVDGMNMTLKGEFGYEPDSVDAQGTVTQIGGLKADAVDNAVSFDTTVDSDKVIKAVKDMIEDFNEMSKLIKNSYSNMPEIKSNGQRYEPLTEEDRKDMTESAVKDYEEKAKTGLLFADRDVSALYRDLTDAVTPSGRDGAILRKIGLEVGYDSDGAMTLSLDEDKMKAALENNPDEVTSAFTKSKEHGASSDGVMVALRKTLDRYSGTMGANKGILIQRAGSPLAPVSLKQNALQEIIDNYDQQIDRWTTKMADQVDYYTGKFTQLEKLINEMNSQSSALMGLMMGGQG